jgi:hypothetical protein
MSKIMRDTLMVSQPAGTGDNKNSNDTPNSDYLLLIHKRHLLFRYFLMSNLSGNGKQYKENIFFVNGILTAHLQFLLTSRE